MYRNITFEIISIESKNLRKLTQYYKSKTYAILQIENLRNITNRKLTKYYKSKVFGILQIESFRNITNRKFSKIFEDFRYIMLYVILRWVWKLTKFLRAKICVSFRTKKIPDDHYKK